MTNLFYMKNPMCPYKTIEKKISKKFTPIYPTKGLCPALCPVCFSDMCEGEKTIVITEPPKELLNAKNKMLINETCESTIPGSEEKIAKFYQKLPKKTNILNLETRFPCSMLKLIEMFDYKSFDNFIVQVSYTGFDEEFRKIFEPGTKSSEKKLHCIKRLIRKGINVSMRLDPLYPNYHTKERIDSILRDFKKIGVKHITVATLKLTERALKRIKRISPSLARYFENSKLFHKEYFLDKKKIRKKIISDTLELSEKYGIKAGVCLEYKKDFKESCGIKPDFFCEGFHMKFSE